MWTIESFIYIFYVNLVFKNTAIFMEIQNLKEFNEVKSSKPHCLFFPICTFKIFSSPFCIVRFKVESFKILKCGEWVLCRWVPQLSLCILIT